MQLEPNSSLSTRAAEAYSRAVADPKGFAVPAARLVEEARRSGDPRAVVLALRAHAWCERGQFAHARAKQLLDRAAGEASRHRLGDLLGAVLVARAAVNHELGRLAAAQRDLDSAARLAGSGRPPELVLQQAALHQNIGRLTEASALYRALLANPQSHSDVRAKAANNLALIEVQRGRPAVAIELLDEAAELAAQVGPAIVAIVAQSRAWVAVHAGRLAESLLQFERAARLYERAGLPLGEHYLEYADALADLRLVREATGMTERAVEQFQAGGVLLMAAEAQLRAAGLAVLSGDFPRAVDAAAQAAREFRRQRRVAWAARAVVVAVEAGTRSGAVTGQELAAARRAAAALTRLGIVSSAVEASLAAGRAALALGRPRLARASLESARVQARRCAVLVRLKGRVAGALACRLEGDDRRVLRQCRAGLTDLAQHRAALPSMELRALASGHGAELGRLGLEVLLRTGSALRVFDWMERTRAAALSVVEPPAGAGFADELAALRAVHTELDQARRAARAEPAELLARQAAIEARVRRATWTRSAAAAGATIPAADIRRPLDGQALVAYGVLDDRLFAVVVQPRRARLVQLGALRPVRHELDVLLFTLHRLARPGAPAGLTAARANADERLRRLGALLIEPLGLPPDAPLVILPVRELQGMPWSPLHPAPTSVAPSAAVWTRTRRPAPADDGHVLLVAGPRLRGAEAEVAAVRRLHDRPTVLVPPASTVAAVTEAFDGAAIAHLACHGHLRSDNPMFSSLALSDGPLTVHELDQRAVVPRRMVLAACDSGAEAGYEGNEMLGFVSALFARGTAAVVASVVAVSDLAALPLMNALHANVRRGATLADALHAARAEIDTDQPGDFVNWCGFSAYGAA